ncbi:MAG: hypothetical protein K2Q06_08230, partial [Parvularculaceae bacterium]|nr:hypothetical protein [Parvularculaceae bacterium]
MSRILIAALALLAGCATADAQTCALGGSTTAARLRALEACARTTDERVKAVEARAAQLSAETAALSKRIDALAAPVPPPPSSAEPNTADGRPVTMMGTGFMAYWSLDEPTLNRLAGGSNGSG